MSAARGDLVIYQGDDFQTVVRVKDKYGADADISAYAALAQLRRTYADADDTIEATFACVIDSPRVVLTLDKSVTVTLAGRYRWDLQLTDAAGVVTTVIAGAVSVQQEVTR